MANPASDELVAGMRDKLLDWDGTDLPDGTGLRVEISCGELRALLARLEAEKARADKAEAERDAIDRSRTFHAARATTAEAARDRLAAVVAEAGRVIEPFARNAPGGDGTAPFDVPDGHVLKFSNPSEPDTPTLFAGDFRAARTWQEKHGEARTDA